MQRSRSVRLRARADLILLAAVTLFGLAVRLYQLGSFPDTVLADEADNAQAAVRILHGQPPPNGFFGFDWTQQPAYSVYLLSGFIGLFGFSIMAIRLPSALLSALSLVPFYLLLRRQFSAATALLSTFLLATNVWYLNFSRSGWNCGHVCLYLVMAMLFLMLALDRIADGRDRRSLLYFAFTGLFCALGLYSYPSGRAISLGIVAFLPFAAWFYRRQWKALLRGYLLAGGVAALLYAPQAVYISRNWEWFNGRTRTVALIHSPDYKADPLATLWKQFQRNVRGPWDGSVNNTAQYTPAHEPQLDPATGWLSLAGLVLSGVVSALRRRPETWLWWSVLVAAWFPTQILTVATPNGARGVVYVPALLYFAAVALDTGLLLASRAWKRPGGSPVVGRLPVAVVSALVLLTGFANVGHYWSWQSSARTRQDRWEYVAASEFPAWATWVVTAAASKQNVTNLGQWHAVHPVNNPSAPAPPARSPVSIEVTRPVR